MVEYTYQHMKKVEGMRRKLSFLIALFLFALSATYASSAGGQFVKVFVNGKQVQSGQIIDGSTMLPLRAIAEALGAYVEWDGKTYSAKIITPQTGAQEPTEGLTLAELNEIGKSVPMIYALDAAGQPFEQGSGFIYGDLLITNYHVVDDSASLRVHFGGKVETVKTELIINNPDADLVAVRLSGYPSLKLASAEPKKGDKVYVLGHPDQRFTISEGTIQSVLEFDGEYSAIVSDADVSPGSSGGVMINASGEAIGIVRGGYGGYSNALHVKHLVEEANKI
jgi:S1-C subfamily serine protease